jgi:hypothetical protein
MRAEVGGGRDPSVQENVQSGVVNANDEARLNIEDLASPQIIRMVTSLLMTGMNSN